MPRGHYVMNRSLLCDGGRTCITTHFHQDCVLPDRICLLPVEQEWIRRCIEDETLPTEVPENYRASYDMYGVLIYLHLPRLLHWLQTHTLMYTK